MAAFYDQEGTARIERRSNGDAVITLDMETGYQFVVNTTFADVEGRHMLGQWRLVWHDDDPDSPNIISRVRVAKIEVDSEKFRVWFRALTNPLHVALTDTDAIMSFAGWFIDPLWLELVEV